MVISSFSLLPVEVNSIGCSIANVNVSSLFLNINPGTIVAPVFSANAAGPSGKKAGLPKKSKTMPVSVKSRSPTSARALFSFKIHPTIILRLLS